MAACLENVYIHGNSNPILKNLLPVTVANILPPLLRIKIKYFAVFDGGEKLRCDREENNPNDKFAVKLVRNDGNKEQCVETHRLTDIRDISLGNVY
jgi:hypothetical protein